MKKKNILSIILALVLAFSLSACGGSDVRADDKLAGRYIPVVGEMLGVALTGEELAGFAFDLESGGKGTMTADGAESNIKWRNDDSTLTISVEKTDIVGTLGTDSFKIVDMLGMGMDITFAREGSEAARPENYLPEEDKFMLGNWQSTAVYDIGGDPADIDPYSLFMSFSADKKVNVMFQGKDLGDHTWSLLGDWGSLDDEGAPEISWDIMDDGIEVSYVIDGEYYTFDCPKGGQIPDSAFAGSAEYSGYWDDEWYGWWMIMDAEGEWEDLDGSSFDVCGAIYTETEDTGYVYLWDETGNIEDPLCSVDVSFEPGASDAGRIKSTGGYFIDMELGEGDWIADPADSRLSQFEHVVEINGVYEGDDGGFNYVIVLRPWGMEWEDIREYQKEFIPYNYDSWYVDVMDGVMPDSMPQ